MVGLRPSYVENYCSIKPCERRPVLCFVVSQNLKRSNYQNWKLIQNKTRVPFRTISRKCNNNNCETKVTYWGQKCMIWGQIFKVFKVKVWTCERWTVLYFRVSRNTKHGQFQNFRMYQKYGVKIVSKIREILFLSRILIEYPITIMECRA